MLSVIAKLPIKEGKMEEIIQPSRNSWCRSLKRKARAIPLTGAKPLQHLVSWSVQGQAALDAHSSSPIQSLPAEERALMAGAEITVMERSTPFKP